MTKLEKAVKGLECCNMPNNHNDCPYNGATHYNICTHQLLTDAIALLKEREPVKPEKSPLSMNDRFLRVIYNCGFCGSRLQGVAKYCVQCGRAVKWE